MSDIVVPRLGVAVTEVEITAWHAEDGDNVDLGDPLLTVATDKTEVDIESPAKGVLTRIGQVDGTYSVGEVIGTIL